MSANQRTMEGLFNPVPDVAKRRIETQIHRRKKAMAVPPLEAEWNIGFGCPPHLRMPPEKMKGTRRGTESS